MKRRKSDRYRVLAEAMAFDKLKSIKVPLDEIEFPRLTTEEIHKIMVEEFAVAKDVAKTKAKQAKDKKLGWDRAGSENLENEINWMKNLKIKECFNLKKE